MDSIEQQIKDLKDKIADVRDYIGSDFCTNCVEMYKQREILELSKKLNYSAPILDNDIHSHNLLNFNRV